MPDLGLFPSKQVCVLPHLSCLFCLPDTWNVALKAEARAAISDYGNGDGGYGRWDNMIEIFGVADAPLSLLESPLLTFA